MLYPNLLQFLENLDNPPAIKLFFEWLAKLISAIPFSPEDERLAIRTCENTRYPQLRALINNRVVLAIYEPLTNIPCRFGFMLVEPPQTLIDEFGLVQDNTTVWYYFLDAEGIGNKNIEPLLHYWLAQCKEYAPTQQRSQSRKYHVPELYEIALNASLLEPYLLEANKNIQEKYQKDFFQEADILFFNERIERSIHYSKNNEEDKADGERLRKKIFEITNLWAKYITQHLPFLTYEPNNTWQNSGALKGYSWTRIFYPNHSHIFFAVGVSAREKALFLNIDCLRTPKTNASMTEAQVAQFDAFAKEHPVPALRISLNELKNLNWKTLLQQSVAYIRAHHDTYLQAYKTVMDKELPSENEELFNAETTVPKIISPIANNAMNKISFPLNQILYGAPGTGKTYHSINYSLAIIGNTSIESIKEIETKNDLDKAKSLFTNMSFESSYATGRALIKAIFDYYQSIGQIAFTTFHQAMSYEDFVEGIKPETTNDGTVVYNIKNGIFKKKCALAAHNAYQMLIKSKPTNTYSFDILYDAFINWIQEQIENKNVPIYKTIRGQEVTIKKVNNNNSILATAKNSKDKNSAPLTKENLQKLYDKFKTIEEIKNLKEVQETVQVTPRTTEFYAVFGGLKEFEKIYKPDAQFIAEEQEVEVIDLEAIEKKFAAGVYDDAIKQIGKDADKIVLIIDEINRGNVAQIFGELITLIEDSKRAGANEALSATLPYSKDTFSVPSNLYIIGTMNTADRSVEALDTALRRRFSFVEMEPDASLLSNALKIKVLETEFELNLELLLETINKRIEILLDKDHCIGHSYFIGLSTFDDLKRAFFDKVLPLLQEYFYGDWAKIGLVLNDAFIEKLNTDGAFGKNSGVKAKAAIRIHKFKNQEEAFVKAVQNIYADYDK